MTMHTDKGLKKAAAQRETRHLPTNFSYRMMERIRQETYLRERRTEKRTFILWLITVTAMITGGIGYLGWIYGEQVLGLCVQVKSQIPPLQDFLMYLPTIIALIILGKFNSWLSKRAKRWR